MKIKKSYLKKIIKNYLNESLNEDDANWLGDDDDQKDAEEFSEEAKIKDLNQYAAEVLESYKNKQLKRLRGQITKENNPYVHISTAANAIQQTSHVFVESIPDFASDEHEQIGTSGTIAIFRYAHGYVDKLKPVGEESIKNYKNAINALNSIKDEKNVKDAYSKVIPLVILNYSDLGARREDTDGKVNAVESVTKHEFDHIKSFVLNSFLKDEGKRINIDVLKTIVRDDLKDKSESEVSSILTKENEGRIETQLLGQIIRQVYPYYKDVFDRHFPNHGHVIPYFWMPKFVEAKDASARTLKLYNEKMKS